MEFNEKVFLLARIILVKTVGGGLGFEGKGIYSRFLVTIKIAWFGGGGLRVKEYIYVLAEYTGGCPRKIRLKIKMHLHGKLWLPRPQAHQLCQLFYPLCHNTF